MIIDDDGGFLRIKEITENHDFPQKSEKKKLCVFGSRSIKDARVYMILQEFLNQNPNFDTIVTTQEPQGVCRLAQMFAKKNGMPLELHFLNFRNGAGAFDCRSKAAIKASDYALVIFDGISKGSTNEINSCKKAKLNHTIIELDASKPTDNVEVTDIEISTAMPPQLTENSWDDDLNIDIEDSEDIEDIFDY